MSTETPKRERQAFDFERAYYENLATKADVEAIVNAAKTEMIKKMGALENRLTWRIIAAAGVVIAAVTLIDRFVG